MLALAEVGRVAEVIPHIEGHPRFAHGATAGEEDLFVPGSVADSRWRSRNLTKLRSETNTARPSLNKSSARCDRY